VPKTFYARSGKDIPKNLSSTLLRNREFPRKQLEKEHQKKKKTPNALTTPTIKKRKAEKQRRKALEHDTVTILGEELMYKEERENMVMGNVGRRVLRAGDR